MGSEEHKLTCLSAGKRRKIRESDFIAMRELFLGGIFFKGYYQALFFYI
jgi:hypothetical protein